MAITATSSKEYLTDVNNPAETTEIVAPKLTESEQKILSCFSVAQKKAFLTYPIATQQAILTDIFQETLVAANNSVELSPKPAYKYSPIQQEKIMDPVFGGKINEIVANIVTNENCNISQQLPSDPAVAATISLFLGKKNWFEAFEDTEESMPLSAILFRKDPELCSKIQAWLQTRLNKAVNEVPNSEMRKVYIGNLLSFLPFFGPVENTIWTLPLGPHNEPISYRLEKIDLTPRWLGSPMVAYGLVPVDPDKGELILLLKGTNYPADEGFFFSLLADLNPFTCVGGYAFHFSAKNRIEKWLKDKRIQLERPAMKVMVAGMSLGGSLALQVVAYLTEYVSSIYAFVPPAVTTSVVAAWDKRKANLALKDHPIVNIYLQNGDPISSRVGRRWALDWKIYHMYAKGAEAKSSFQAHAAAYSAQKNAFLMPASPEIENQTWKRRLWPIVQNFVNVPFFLIGVALLPLFCIVHNIIRLAKYCFTNEPELIQNNIDSKLDNIDSKLGGLASV